MRRHFEHSTPIKLLCWVGFLVLATVAVTWTHLRQSFDVIVAHNMPDFLVFAGLLPKLLGAKVVLDLQDVSPELMAAKSSGRMRAVLWRLAAWQERLSTAFADHVVTTGSIFEKLLLQRGVPREKLSSTLNSADPKLFPADRRCPPSARAQQGERDFVIFYYGTVAERCGVDIAVRALALALPIVPTLRLDIMGMGEHMSVVRQLAEQLGVSDRVVFAPWSDPTHVIDFINRGDAGIIPYRCDGFADLLLPTKAYELAWMRRPIIASDTIAMRSMFQPDAIMLCDWASPEAFAEAFIDLYQHPEKQQALAAAAARDYLPYRWEIESKAYQLLLASVARGRQSVISAATSSE